MASANESLSTDLMTTDEMLFAELRKHIGNWYLENYGDIEAHRAKIDLYATSAPERVAMLTGPLLDKLDAAPPRRLLDVGCGFGHVALYLAHRWPTSEILATDVSDRYYSCAAAAAKDLNITNIRFEPLPVESIESGPDFDVVVSSNMLMFMNSRERLENGLQIMAEAVAPNGYLLIYTSHFWTIFEPFSQVPFLHFLPRRVQDFVVRRLGKRPSLSDVRNPGIGEVARIVRRFDMRRVFLSHPNPLHRLIRNHITLAFQKS